MNASMTGRNPDAARLVLFVGGFDPRGARHYHRLMREESQKQAAVQGERRYVIGPREPWNTAGSEKSPHSMWRVQQQGLKAGTDVNVAASVDASVEERADQCADTEFVFFDWHDQVRANWPESRARVFSDALPTYAEVWRSRQWLAPIHRQARFTLWALAYPIVYAVLVCALGLLLGGLLGAALAGFSSAAAAVAACVAWALVCWGGFVLDGHIHVSWLLRILNFARSSSEQGLPVLDARMEAMAAEVAQGMRQGRWREVVVLGFSVGSVQAVKLVVALRQQLAADQSAAPDAVLASAPAVGLVTLGNCIPLFGLFPGARSLRGALQALALDPLVYWADISSPSDSVCFGMCDVVGLSLREDAQKSAKPSGTQWGLNPQAMCSPRFHKLFHPAGYRWLRRNKMRMHFQYLMAGEIAGSYDYFELLSSPGLVRDYIRKKLVR
ncbi:MAG: hypothetical protein LBE51_14120 [Acidovorax sp.]|jgi:hypothetical protein|nr:hypothetical protein [Acidovorax sp.]